MGTNKIWRPLLFVVGLSASDALLAASCEYDIRNEWGSGFTVAVTLTNDTSATINDWSVSWAYSDGASVSQAWDASLSGSNPYVATNYSYNGTLAVGESVSFGFNGSKSVNGAPAEVPTLGGSCTSAATNAAPIASFTSSSTVGSIPFTVNFDASASSDPDGDAITYHWDFGGGDVATGAVVSRLYDAEGSYPVSLVVNDGLLDSIPATSSIVANNDVIEPSVFTLDPSSSSLYFVSAKNAHNVETHTFTTLSGAVSETGIASLKINLDSVDTGIAIRNERIRNLLFETTTFTQAVVTLSVDLDALSSQALGSAQQQNVTANLDLHGVSSAITTDIIVTKLSSEQFLVQSASPILIKAVDHNLEAGVEALRAIANLSVISTTIPVSFTLQFNATEAE